MSQTSIVLKREKESLTIKKDTNLFIIIFIIFLPGITSIYEYSLFDSIINFRLFIIHNSDFKTNVPLPACCFVGS